MRVVLIQHLLELTERSNTGRHAVGVVPSLDVRVFGARDAALKVDDLAGAWLLWPGEPPPLASAGPPSCVVVLDGSWSQARLAYADALAKAGGDSLPKAVTQYEAVLMIDQNENDLARVKKTLTALKKQLSP